MFRKALAKLGLVRSLPSGRSPASPGMTIEDASKRLLVSSKLVDELKALYNSGEITRQRARQIGEHLYQMGGPRSMEVAREALIQVVGEQAGTALDSTGAGLQTRQETRTPPVSWSPWKWRE